MVCGVFLLWRCAGGGAAARGVVVVPPRMRAGYEPAFEAVIVRAIERASETALS